MSLTRERHDLPEFNDGQRAQSNSFESLLKKSKAAPVEAIIVLGGGSKQIITGNEKKAEIFSGKDVDPNGIELIDLVPEELEPGRSARMSTSSFNNPIRSSGKAKDIAAVEIAKQLNITQTTVKPEIITNSRGAFTRTAQTEAEVSAAAINKYGLPNEITAQNWSIDTFTELLETVRMAYEKKLTHIAIVTQKTQQRRAEAMLHSLLNISDPEELKKVELMMAYNANRFNRENKPHRLEDLNHFNQSFEILKEHTPTLTASLVAAEDVLVYRNPKLYGKIIADLKKDAAYTDRVTRDESDGIRWKSGDYTNAGVPHLEQWKNGQLP